MSSRIVIKNWFHRFGDNVFQIIRAIHVGIYLNKRMLDFPKHFLFKNTEIQLLPTGSPGQIKGQFDNFKSTKCGHIEQNILNTCSVINHDRIEPLLKYILNIKSNDYFSENDLCIYMRSGDLFGSKCTNITGRGGTETSIESIYNRVQPPLDFYKKVIESRRWGKIRIVCEDTNNPNVNELLKLYPEVVYKKSSISEDIETILSATNITYYNGNFLDALYIFSNTLKRFYCFGKKFTNQYKSGYECIYYSANDYYEQMGPWMISKSQLKLMTTFKLNSKPECI